MERRNIDTSSSLGTTPLLLRKRPFPASLECPTLSPATKWDLQGLHTYKELCHLQALEPNPLSTAFCQGFMSRFSEVLTRRPIPIVKRTGTSLRSESPLWTSPNRQNYSPMIGRPLLSQPSPEIWRTSPSPSGFVTTEPGETSAETIKSRLQHWNLFVESGFTDPLDLVNHIQFLINSLTHILKTLPNGGAVTREKTPCGSTTSTQTSPNGSLDSLRFGPIGTPSKHRPKEDPWSLDHYELLSHPTTPSPRWDSTTETLSQFADDFEN